MEKINLERGVLPQNVALHQTLCTTAKKEGVNRKVFMPPEVREYYKIADARKKLRSIAKCKDRKSKKYDIEAYTEEVAFHIRQTHPQQDNKAIVFWKYVPEFYMQEQLGQQGFSIEELSAYKLFRLLKLGRKVNLYISNCDFLSTYSRQSQYVKSVSALQLDIDYYTIPTLASLPPEEVYNKICNEVFAPLGMLPSYSIFSGKGLYLVFLTETMDLMDNPRQQQLYNKLMDRLITLTLPYGADPSCKDFSRVLRLPSTINQKSGAVARILDFDTVSSSPIIRYEIAKIAALLGVDPTEEPAPKPKPTPRSVAAPRCPATTHAPFVGVVGTLRTLGEARTKDLLKWLQSRSCNIKGNRNTFFLFLSCSLLAYMPEDKAWSYLQKVNRQLAEPQPLGELSATFKSATANHKKRTEGGRGYFSFSNEYIIDRLQIDENEMQGFVTIITEEEKNRRDYEHRKKLRRNEQDNTSREQAKADKMARVQLLLAEGKTQTQIALVLGVSRQLVNHYVKLSNETVAV